MASRTNVLSCCHDGFPSRRWRWPGPSWRQILPGRTDTGGRLFQLIRSTHIMGDGCFACRTHMAGRAGWRCIIILTNHPLGAVQVHPVLVGMESNTMLGFFIDLDLWMIRAHMAFAAIFRGYEPAQRKIHVWSDRPNRHPLNHPGLIRPIPVLGHVAGSSISVTDHLDL